MKDGIDAGHGKTDPGAVSPLRPEMGDNLYTEEDNIALLIAKRTQGILLACGDQVVMTRDSDTYVSLQKRTQILNEANCDVAVSLHLNSSSSVTAVYVSSYIQGTGGSAEKLAQCIQPCLIRNTGWPDGGIRVQDLHMTRETKMPAVLVELGFVSNPWEEQQLNEPYVYGLFASAIAEGILAYAGEINPWQRNLLNAAKDIAAGQAELERAGEVWKMKTDAGDSAGADSAHNWANKVRQAMGLPTT